MEATTFDPSKYLTTVSGAAYLEVKWRLVWLRAQHPDADIQTELLSDDGSRAVVRARIQIPGAGAASGIGNEDKSDFRDYIEKAETKAIGRACGALGFGTQFARDFEFGADDGRVVDAPVGHRAGTGERPINFSDRATSQPGQAATPRQLTFMEAVAREIGLSADDLQTELQQAYGRAAHELTRREASAFIERLQNRKASLGVGT